MHTNFESSRQYIVNSRNTLYNTVQNYDGIRFRISAFFCGILACLSLQHPFICAELVRARVYVILIFNVLLQIACV